MNITKNKNIPRLKTSLWFVVSITLVALISFWLHGFLNPDVPKGKIAYFRNTANDDLSELIITNGNGNSFISLGRYRGSFSLSRDGKNIAVGCTDSDERICILEVYINDLEIREFPAEQKTLIVSSVNLPGPCVDGPEANFIYSISWSRDNKKLVVVCGENHLLTKPHVCIVDLIDDTQSYCWENQKVLYVVRAEWSPEEDILLLSSTIGYGSKIYTSNINGGDLSYITDGWAASWSPDGERIAYMQWQNNFYSMEDGELKIDENISQYTGLASVDKNGENVNWLYRNPEQEIDNTKIISFNCTAMDNNCRLSWSPDGQYIVFVGSNGGTYNFRVFRLNVNTGKIIYISHLDENSRFVLEPEWSK